MYCLTCCLLTYLATIECYCNYHLRYFTGLTTATATSDLRKIGVGRGGKDWQVFTLY